MACVFILAQLAACGPKEPPQPSQPPESPVAEEPGEPVGQPEYYAFETVLYAKDDIVIKYPRIIEGAGDLEAMSALIEEAARRDLSFIENDERSYAYELDYQVTYNAPGLISVLFSGYRSPYGAAHPTYFLRTITLDTAKAQTVRLGDLVTIDEAFAEAVKNGRYTLLHEEMSQEYIDAVRSLIEDMGAETWLERLRQTDDPAAEECSYLTETALGISIPVPHVLGGHIEILLDYADLEPYRAPGSLLPRGEGQGSGS